MKAVLFWGGCRFGGTIRHKISLQIHAGHAEIGPGTVILSIPDEIFLPADHTKTFVGLGSIATERVAVVHPLNGEDFVYGYLYLLPYVIGR